MTTDAESLAAAAADECRRILEEKDRLLTAARDERDAAREALREAACSLEWLSRYRVKQGASEDDLSDALSEIRAYAHSRARVARAALPVPVPPPEPLGPWTEADAAAVRREVAENVAPAPVPPGETRPTCWSDLRWCAEHNQPLTECAAPAAHPETTPEGHHE